MLWAHKLKQFMSETRLSKNKSRKSPFFELKIALAIGAIMGTIIGSYTKFFYEDLLLGIAVGISMSAGILSSAVIGTLIPFFIEKLGKDPAVGSGPFATIVQDIVSILIYFLIASIVLKI